MTMQGFVGCRGILRGSIHIGVVVSTSQTDGKRIDLVDQVDSSAR